MQKDQMVVHTFGEFFKLERTIHDEWNKLHMSKQPSERVRSIIASSWERCIQKEVNPFAQHTQITYEGDSLQAKKEQNSLLLDIANPYIEDFFQRNTDIGWYLIDKDGIILVRRTNKRYSNEADELQVVEGADLSERAGGTTGPALALIEKRPVQVFSGEHFMQSFHPYIDSAVPIRDPFSRQILGVIHMAANKNIVEGHNISTLIHQVSIMERDIGSKLVEHNFQAFESIFEAIEKPVILFDTNGVILRYNRAAEYMLKIQPQKSLTEFIDISAHSSEWREVFIRGVKGVYQGIDNSKWEIDFKPYKISSILNGSMAIFQKKQFSPSFILGPKALRDKFSKIKTKDPSMLTVIELAKKAALTDKTLLITGETGTGKEILTKAIHSHSSRHTGPFIEINCGAIPHELVASELFGYEKGSFTGASTHGKKGKFLMANHGTIFLDEIGDLPLQTQVYLLRVLEERTVVPIGGSKPIPINVRVIAATNKNLEEEVKKGNFREDLYHRLNIISLTLPPLRERKNDIFYLVDHFLSDLCKGNQPMRIANDVMKALCSYTWPGNIRQLKNTIDKMVFHAENEWIQFEDLPPEIKKQLSVVKEMKEELEKEWVFRRKRIDKEMLQQALIEANGNIARTAGILNTSRGTIYNKLKQFGLFEQT